MAGLEGNAATVDAPTMAVNVVNHFILFVEDVYNFRLNGNLSRVVECERCDQCLAL